MLPEKVESLVPQPRVTTEVDAEQEGAEKVLCWVVARLIDLLVLALLHRAGES